MGNRTIWTVILAFIAMILINFYSSTIRETMAVNEIQGIMDQAGVIALREAVDDTDLRDEELSLNESLAVTRFTEIMNEKLNHKMANNGLITNWELENVKIYTRRGQSNYLEYYLDSTISANFSNMPNMDRNHRSIQYTDLELGRRVTKDVDDTENDGESGILIHSVSRLTLR